MGWGWLRNPWHTVPLIWGGSLASIMALAVAQYQSPDANLTYFLALAFAVFAASFGGNIAMWLQANIQQARWIFENVYRPLFKDTLSVVAGLRDYQYVRLETWREIKESSLGQFVQEDIFDGLKQLERDLDDLHTARWKAIEVAETVLYSGLDELRLPPDPSLQLPNLVRALKDSWGQPFLLHPKVDLPPDHVIDNVLSYLRQITPGASREEVVEFLRRSKATFVRDETISGYVRKVNEIRSRAESLHGRILDRLHRPIP